MPSQEKGYLFYWDWIHWSWWSRKLSELCWLKRKKKLFTSSLYFVSFATKILSWFVHELEIFLERWKNAVLRKKIIESIQLLVVYLRKIGKLAVIYEWSDVEIKWLLVDRRYSKNSCTVDWCIYLIAVGTIHWNCDVFSFSMIGPWIRCKISFRVLYLTYFQRKVTFRDSN